MCWLAHNNSPWQLYWRVEHGSCINGLHPIGHENLKKRIITLPWIMLKFKPQSNCWKLTLSSSLWASPQPYLHYQCLSSPLDHFSFIFFPLHNTSIDLSSINPFNPHPHKTKAKENSCERLHVLPLQACSINSFIACTTVVIQIPYNLTMYFIEPLTEKYV